MTMQSSNQKHCQLSSYELWTAPQKTSYNFQKSKSFLDYFFCLTKPLLFCWKLVTLIQNTVNLLYEPLQRFHQKQSNDSQFMYKLPIFRPGCWKEGGTFLKQHRNKYKYFTVGGGGKTLDLAPGQRCEGTSYRAPGSSKKAKTKQHVLQFFPTIS